MAFLRNRGAGIDTHGARVPIVSAAVMFDLLIGRPDAYQPPAMGRKAPEDAAKEFDEGPRGPGWGRLWAKPPGLELSYQIRNRDGLRKGRGFSG